MGSPLGRRTFISRIAAAGVVGGSLPALEELDGRVSLGSGAFSPSPQDSDEKVFAAARRELLFPTSIAFCNSGTAGASAREVVETIVNAYRSIEQELPDWAYRPKPTDTSPWTGYLPHPQFRREVGAFLNAPLEEIALTQNTTMGMSLLANGLDLQSGDEILTTDQEHPGGLSPWLLRQKRHGVVVRQLALGPVLELGPDAVVQLFADAITPRTRVVMCSHITSILGIKLPVREVCALARDRGVVSIVDGAQAVGQTPVDVKAIGCDAYAASGHKRLAGPKGTGILYIRAEAQDRFWSTLVTTGFDDRSTGAFRFMRFGTGSLPAVLGLLAAIRFIIKLGVERIERWDRMLTTRLREGLARMPHVRLTSPADPRFAAAITTFNVAGRTSDAIQDALWERKIRARAEGAAGLRMSAHYYVSPSDITRALDVVESMA